MNIFITGATGVVGRRVVPALVQAGHRVSAAIRSAANADGVDKAGADAIRVDLFDRDALCAAVADHDVVVNLATHIPSSALRMLLPRAWRENDRIRTIASAHLVDAALAAGAKRFIQESFAPVYPDHGDAWVSEALPLAPARYNRSIVDAEAAARRFADAGSVAVVLRFAAFYGPDAVQSHAMIDAVRRGYSPLPGADDAYLSSVAHDDAATAVLAALRLPAGVYNVADDQPLRRREFAAALASSLHVGEPRPLPGWLTALTGSMGELMSRSLRISNRKLRDASDWRPRFPSAREGWPATVAAIRAADATGDDGDGRPQTSSRSKNLH